MYIEIAVLQPILNTWLVYPTIELHIRKASATGLAPEVLQAPCRPTSLREMGFTGAESSFRACFDGP